MFYKLFKSFFDTMDGIQPSVILSDEQLSIEKGINELKLEGSYEGEHMLDTFHIIYNLFKKFKSDHIRQAFR